MKDSKIKSIKSEKLSNETTVTLIKHGYIDDFYNKLNEYVTIIVHHIDYVLGSKTKELELTIEEFKKFKEVIKDFE